jgi:predicted nucleic acid-binding protein
LSGFLLDTNIVSEIRKRKPHGAVSSWFAAVPPDQIFLPGVVLGELQAGVEITRIQDAAKALEIDEWISRVAATLTFCQWMELVFANTPVRCTAVPAPSEETP